MKFTRLTDDQRQQFDEAGDLIVRNALDEAEVSRLIEAATASLLPTCLKDASPMARGPIASETVSSRTRPLSRC